MLISLATAIHIHPNPFSLGQDDCGRPMPCLQYSNLTQEKAARAWRIAEDVGLLILIFNMLCSKSVRNYFQLGLPAKNQSRGASAS